MKKTVRFISVVLVLFMLTGILPLSGMAYGEADGKLSITHFNVGYTEGAGVIITPIVGDKVSAAGNTFAWWRLITFEWSEADSCYKITNIQANANNSDKSNTVVPDNGFVYAINIGNNYSSSGGINYQSANITNSYNYVAKLTVGQKAYVYNADLTNLELETNGALWYSPDYSSSAYIKIGTPDETGYLYNPVHPTDLIIQRTLSLTDINTYGDAAGHSILFTRAYGNNIYGSHTGTGDSNYSWWKTAVFEWNDTEECFIVSGVDNYIGPNYPKQAVIPENGFVIAVCTDTSNSSDPTITTFGNMDKIKTGAKAYLYGADLTAGTLSSSAKICINISDENLAEVTPVLSGERLTAPTLTNMTGNLTTTLASGFTVEWAAVTGATGYVVNINNSTFTINGTLIADNISVTGTTYSIPGAKLTLGNIYTVSVYAIGTGKTSSLISRAKLCVIREDAVGNSLRDKKIVAFGDSLTARPGWVNMLGGSLGMELINSGVSGDTSSQGRARFDAQVLAKNPDIVIINFGMNDQAQLTSQNKPLTSLTTYTENLEYFAKTLTEANVDVVFVTPNPVCTASGYYTAGGYNLNYGTNNMLSFCEAMRKVAIKYDCGLVDINTECGKDDLTKICAAGDGIHLANYGQQKYCKLIGDYLLAVNTENSSTLSTVSVNYVDNDNKTIAATKTLSGAVGATILIPGADISGYTLGTSAANYTFTENAGSLIFSYTEEIKEITLKETSAFSIDNGKLLINGEKMTADTVLAQLQTAGVTCTCKTGTYVGTGSVLQLKSGNTVIVELTVILPGDASGDGQINAQDYLMLKRHFLGTYTLKDEYLGAADMDHNGSITSADYLKVKRHFLGTYHIFA